MTASAASGWGPSGGEFARAPDGVRLALYEWGNPAGPEILLIHGFAQCHLCFMPQIASELAQRFRLVAYDQRGHGGSDKPADPTAYQGPEVWADDLAAVMAAKRLRRPLLVGWSMGGRVIRQYLMRRGDAGLAGINFVASLVIEDPEARGPAASRSRQSGERSLAEQIQAAIDFLDACYAIKPDAATFQRGIGYNMLVPQSVRAAIGGWTTDAAETRAALARVRVPVLISHGRRDAIVLPIAAEAAAAAIQGARISWYDDCGHSPFQEAAARFNDELARFAEAVAVP